VAGAQDRPEPASLKLFKIFRFTAAYFELMLLLNILERRHSDMVFILDYGVIPKNHTLKMKTKFPNHKSLSLSLSS
jgi:hypothetical protein